MGRPGFLLSLLRPQQEVPGPEGALGDEGWGLLQTGPSPAGSPALGAEANSVTRRTYTTQAHSERAAPSTLCHAPPCTVPHLPA